MWDARKPDQLAQMQAKWERTKKRTEQFRDAGYDVKEMWECQFGDKCKRDPDISDFVNSRQSPFFRMTRYNPQSGEEILQAVKSKVFFGMLEVSLTVPEQWQGDFRPSLPPREYFAEMCPFFGECSGAFRRDWSAHARVCERKSAPGSSQGGPYRRHLPVQDTQTT